MPSDTFNLSNASVDSEDARPVNFFKEIHQTFQQAEQLVGGPVNRFYTIGGYTVQLRFASPALVPSITPALEHLAAEPGQVPALTVCLWDSVSTRTEMPPPPWSADDYLVHGQIRGYNDDCICTAVSLVSGALSMVDINRNLALWWIRDASRFPYYESGSPLITILHWWMGRNKRQYIHAGAVGKPEGGVLLIGKGGSGKSTTALACLNSDLVYVGDDYCLLAVGSNPYVYSLYNSGKLDRNSIQNLQHLTPAIHNPDCLESEKLLIFLHQHYPKRIVDGFPIRAILLPHVTGFPRTTLTPTTPAIGFKTLAPNTMFQFPGVELTTLRALAKLVKKVPCYHIELGTDLSEIPDTILGVL